MVTSFLYDLLLGVFFMKNYFNLNQPLSRGSYWRYQVVFFFFGFVLEFLSRMMFDSSGMQLAFLSWSDILGVNFIKVIFIFLTLMNIVFQARRLLDIGLPRSISLMTLLILVSPGVFALIGSVPSLACLLLKRNSFVSKVPSK